MGTRDTNMVAVVKLCGLPHVLPENLSFILQHTCNILSKIAGIPQFQNILKCALISERLYEKTMRTCPLELAYLSLQLELEATVSLAV